MIRTLNSLRFILILMIATSHSTLSLSQGLHDYLGEFSVATFFVISGFVLSLSKGEKLKNGELNNRRFFLSRVFKLYPLHIIILLITLLLDWRLGNQYPWYQILSHALLLQCWYPTHDFMAVLNASTWFLSNIIFFYLIFRYLYKWLVECSWLSILPIIFAYMAVYIAISLIDSTDKSAGYIYSFPPFRMIDFCVGILIYKFYSSDYGKKIADNVTYNLSLSMTWLLDMLWFLLIVGIYSLSILCNPNIRCAILYWTPSALTVFYMTICDGRKEGLANLFHNKFLLWLGGISMEIYLVHGLCFRIVQSIFLKIYGEPIPTYMLGFQFCISLSLIIIVAWLARQYIVIPIYNKSNQCTR